MLSQCARRTLGPKRRAIRAYTAMASPQAPSWTEWRLNPPTAIPSDSQTLSHHAELPKLPVASLQSTADKIRRSAKALAKSDKEYDELCRKLDDFLAPGGAGEKLDKKLRARAAQQWVVVRLYVSAS